MKEEWKEIKGIDNCYISNLGRVKSFTGKILVSYVNTHGYLQTRVGKGKQQKKLEFIGRLLKHLYLTQKINHI